MYDNLTFLKKWYEVNESKNSIAFFNNTGDTHNATYIKNIDYDKDNFIIRLTIAKPKIVDLNFSTTPNEKIYYLNIIETNYRTIDIETDCLILDVGFLYYLSNITEDVIINNIFFDLTNYELNKNNFVINLGINDTANMFLSFPMHDFPDFKLEKLRLPKFDFIHKKLNLKDILYRNSLKVNVFINYQQFNILLKEQAILFTNIFNKITSDYPLKIVYQSVFAIDDPAFEYELTKDIVYPTKLYYIIYSPEQFCNKFKE
jgi:hypothetical protein